MQSISQESMASPAPPPAVVSDEQMAIRRGVRNRKSFAWKLFKFNCFTKEQRQGRNVNGVGKQPLDAAKMQQLRRLCFRYFPVEPAGNYNEEEKEWRKLTRHIKNGEN